MTTDAEQQNSGDPGASSLLKSFARWKFNLLDAMLRDPKMKPVDFPIAYAIIQHVNGNTRIAIVSDQKLQLLVHRDRKALTRARKRLVSLGWLEVRTGCYNKATEYQFHDERAKLLENIRLDEQILDKENVNNEGEIPYCDTANSETKTPHRVRRHNGAKAPHSGTVVSGAKTPHCETEAKTPHSDSQWGKNLPHSGAEIPHLHLQTPRDSLPVKGRVSTRTYDAHVHAHDRWVELEETAARLESDEELPRHEAEHRARILCGFDDDDADSRQGAGTALPTVTKCNPREGTPDG